MNVKVEVAGQIKVKTAGKLVKNPEYKGGEDESPVKEVGGKFIKLHAFTVDNAWLNNDRAIKVIGSKKPCLCCGEEFVIGERELFLAQHEYKGRNVAPIKKEVIEVWAVEADSIIEVDLRVNPIDFSKYTMQEKAVIFGVNGVNSRVCPTCLESNLKDCDNNVCTQFGIRGNAGE